MVITRKIVAAGLCAVLSAGLVWCPWSGTQIARAQLQGQRDQLTAGMNGRQRGDAARSGLTELHMAQQYGLGYLPLMVVRQYRLIQKHLSRRSLSNVRVGWALYPSGKAMNSALETGLLDFAAGGVAPMIALWDRTHLGTDAVRGVAALSSMPQYLNTTNERVRSVADFGPQDRIALPAKGASVQAITLRMAATRRFGVGAVERLDPLTVSLPHPMAMASLLQGRDGITAHFASPPFQNYELEHPGVHRVVSSFEILDGPATFTALWAREGLRASHPEVVEAVFAALQEAIQIINDDVAGAVSIYVQQGRTEFPRAFLEKVLADPAVQYTVTPQGVMKYAAFMYATGTIRNKPADWRDLFFDTVYPLPGS